MGVICFASLKGGVGKTTLSLNIASALAERGCQTLVIDLDPAGHTSRFFRRTPAKDLPAPQAPLARLFLSGRIDPEKKELGSIIETAMSLCIPVVNPVRPRLALLPAGPELRHFFWGKAARAFRAFFPRLLDELRCSYDYIVIDTPPDYNVLSRNAIANADLAVVPVDASAMSIDCLEELIHSSAHIKGPTWCILRTMVNRQASRIQELSTARLHSNLQLTTGHGAEGGEEDIEDADRFISMLEKRGRTQPAHIAADGSESDESDNSPIYLLNNLIYRTEQQNRLSFIGKTAFDARATMRLAQQYARVARELEELLALMNTDTDGDVGEVDFMSVSHSRDEQRLATR